MNTITILLTIVICLLVILFVGILILRSAIQKNTKDIQDIASGVSILAQTSDQNAKTISIKIEKIFAETFAELEQRIDVLPKYDDDDLYDEVQYFVETEGCLSTNTIQRTFRIGYSRAVRIIEDLEDNEVIEKFKDPDSNYASWRLVKDED